MGNAFSCYLCFVQLTWRWYSFIGCVCHWKTCRSTGLCTCGHSWADWDLHLVGFWSHHYWSFCINISNGCCICCRHTQINKPCYFYEQYALCLQYSLQNPPPSSPDIQQGWCRQARVCYRSMYTIYDFPLLLTLSHLHLPYICIMPKLQFTWHALQWLSFYLAEFVQLTWVIVLYIPPIWPFHNLALISCFITGPMDGRLWGVSDSIGVR